MRLFFERKTRRFVGLLIVLFCTIPFGLSVVGCGHHTTVVYCNAGESGPVVGQVTTIVLAQQLATVGESLNFGQIGQGLSASATDCKGNSVTVSKYTFSTTDMNIADVNPNTGAVCGGTWNRQSGGGIPDYTLCTPPASTPSNYEAFITASAEGATSNAIPVFIHPVVTGVQLTTPNPSACSTDPTTACCPNVTTTPEAPAPAYDGLSCISQNNRVQLTAKVYANGKIDPADNITCKVGHLTFSAQGANNVVTIDSQGFATANQPGSTLITSTVANSSSASSAGFFSTCPPASIQLSAVGQSGSNINVALNNTQPLTAVVKDTNGNTITGVSLEFNSTTPQTISATSGSVIPTFPGSATITAVCQPPACNPSPESQIGYLGNGKPLTSNGITVNTAGTSGTVIYIGSTQSQYLVPVDFTQNQQGAPIKLQYVPNSMVISEDGSTIYLGSPQGIMTVSTASNQASGALQSVPGKVLAVSPDGSTIVVTDPTRQTVSLVTSSGVVATSYGNLVGTSAAWSPDSQTVYITTNQNVLLTHSTFANWRLTPTNTLYKNVAVMVPAIGAYFAGSETDGRTYCPATSIVTQGGSGNPATTSNVFAPLADSVAVQTDTLATTTDGQHILGATAATSPAVIDDIQVTLPANGTQPNGPQACTTANGPVTFSSTVAPVALASIQASAIGGVIPASNSAIAFVTYTGASGLLPAYLPGSHSLNYVQLANGAKAPISGVFSTDDKTFFTGTSGDNQIHLISVTGSSAKESGTIINPKLTGADGTTPVAPDLIVQKPKKLQS